MQTIKPKQYVNLASNLFRGKLEGELDFTDIPSIMLWGQPGVGKSASQFALAKAIDNMAKEIGRKIKTIVTVLDLTLYSPVDLRGIPTADEHKESAVWLKPSILNLKSHVWVDETTDTIVQPTVGYFNENETINIPNGFKQIGSKRCENNRIKVYIVPVNAEKYDVVNLLYLEELSSAMPSIQVCAYQITHDRRIGEHNLPKNTYPMCAGNRTTDKSVAYAMPKALANRMIHLEFDTNNYYRESWLEWAIQNDIDQRVVAFLGFNEGNINKFDASNKELAFATPRSWENVSKVLKLIPDLETASPFVAGLVGEGMEAEFRAYCNVYTKLPKIEDIANGTFTKQFTEPDINYAISTMIVMNLNKLEADQISNVIKYVLNMRADFSAMTGRSFLYVTEALPKFIHTSEWLEWLNKNNSYLMD